MFVTSMSVYLQTFRNTTNHCGKWWNIKPWSLVSLVRTFWKCLFLSGWNHQTDKLFTETLFVYASVSFHVCFSILLSFPSHCLWVTIYLIFPMCFLFLLLTNITAFNMIWNAFPFVILDSTVTFIHLKNRSVNFIFL